MHLCIDLRFPLWSFSGINSLHIHTKVHVNNLYFPNNIYIYIHFVCSFHLILHSFIDLIIFGSHMFLPPLNITFSIIKLLIIFNVIKKSFRHTYLPRIIFFLMNMHIFIFQTTRYRRNKNKEEREKEKNEHYGTKHQPFYKVEIL